MHRPIQLATVGEADELMTPYASYHPSCYDVASVVDASLLSLACYVLPTTTCYLLFFTCYLLLLYLLTTVLRVRLSLRFGQTSAHKRAD